MDRPARAPQDCPARGDATVLVPRDCIARRLDALAAELTADHAAAEITLLAVLTGALVFVADLIRRLEMPVRIEVAQVRSYPHQTTRSQGAAVTLPGPGDLVGRRVLIADDILDSGRTLETLLAHIRDAGAAEVRTCVLLRKQRGRPTDVSPDYVGFDVPDVFVVGYGLDYNNLYRNLPDICMLPAAEESPSP
ncbi:MAG: hypoxanthine phosphoribosyltransferase [Planctomycetota bacterium]